jgi:hypothetical protein
MRLFVTILSALLLAACASYSGRGLKPGEAQLADVLRVMGDPTMQWQEPDGSRQLAYRRGYYTFMVDIGPNGKLQKIKNIMNMKTFSRIQPDMTKSQVIRILGPSYPPGTAYFKARDELALEWLYCDEWNQKARFDVLFDASKETVRSTLSLTDEQRGFCGNGSCPCGNAN